MSNDDKTLTIKGEDPLDRIGRREKENYLELGEKALARRILVKAAAIARRFWWLGLLLFLALWALLNPTVMNLAFLGLRVLGQLAFAVVFMVVQFGALFWFMARTRTVVIKPGDPKGITFDDYWGQPHLVELVKQWISLLADRDDFVKMGGQYINGLMLTGEPGTGKTMLAKAMAGEAGIAFMSVEGSGFRGMFWGMDTLKMMSFVRKARKLAREYGACIAYIDEIDAVAMSRSGVQGSQQQMGGGGMMGGMMMNGALTRLLYEMDGIAEPSRAETWKAKIAAMRGKPPPLRNWHVLFMGSTNRPDVLDPALLRPGRFDQVIQVDRPDRVGRRAIIEGYLSKIRHDAKKVDIEAIVADTPRTTPAQVMAAITKDSVRHALFQGRNHVIQEDIDQSIQEQIVGMANPVREMDPLQKRQIAYHEAGHAILQHYMMPDKRISRVSIVRRSKGILGYVLPVDTVEIYGEPLRRIVADIMVALGGHICVKLFMGEFWTGATSDFQAARMQLRKLAMLGFFGPPVSELYADVKELRFSDERVENVWKHLEDQVERTLYQHADEVEALMEALMKKDELSNTELLEILGKNSLQLAVDEGLEMESVLEQLGVNPSGLAYQRREQMPADKKVEEPAAKAALSSDEEKKRANRKSKGKK
ncbi:MAG: AAA family ATPase [Chloroflexi bacterium]|nr:AAA family ATPase [Chloroflexota bacterium]